MAEHAANISSLQHHKPNILELIAQESFVESVFPAVKALCSYTASKNRSLNWLEKWYDEVFGGINLMLQYYYLKLFHSSFSEAFYGLKRIPIFSHNQQTKKNLPSNVICSSLFFLVFIPYMNRKLEAAKRDHDDRNLQVNPESQKIANVIFKLQKSIGFVYGIFRIYFLISYLSGKTKVHDPLLKLSGVELVYQERHLPSWRDMLRAVFLNKSDSSKLRLSFLFKLIGASLEIGAFFIQFLNWWNSDESKQVTNLPLPNPPHLNNGTDVCPICHNKRKNEVVLYTSGYVFCYICIKNYLDEKGRCPLTHLPASVDNIVRIYSTTGV
ncbi:peroxisome assembly protein 12 [Halyomorpha halys]|uniref:peroxisome assembly protein 12 n=1 Tax=Halyomorpha halys TaxID=286706 RepID=UPI0006D4FD91|nr:peroxisome assembly protein 12 [Halyomorpha halys]